jgi:hypothetical protein
MHRFYQTDLPSCAFQFSCDFPNARSASRFIAALRSQQALFDPLSERQDRPDSTIKPFLHFRLSAKTGHLSIT